MKVLASSMAAALGVAVVPANAVMLNARGTGQVLIYPYYTVNHQQTLVSVINTTAHGKALKVRFREGYNGRDVANFNVYLGPYDSWVGAVFDTSSDGTGGAAIATNDNSCTVPAFPLAPVPGRLHALPFSNANYSQGDYGTPTGTDSGPTNLARTREGFFEIIEMGEVVDQATNSQKTLEAIMPVNGTPPGCAQVQAAWATGGYWKANPGIDLLPPAGGVYGAAGIVNVAQGTLYAYDATAIDGFSDVAQHTGPGDAKPNLGTAVTDSAHDMATAYVPIGNAMIKADYPASTRGVDAVSAVLMVDALYNEFDVESGLGAATDLLITLPTKQYYVDPGITGSTAKVPFDLPFGDAPSGTGVAASATSCSTVGAVGVSRDGDVPVDCSLFCAPPPPPLALCFQANVITTAGISALGSTLSVQTGYARSDFFPQYDAGHVRLEFTVDAFNAPVATHALAPAANGDSFRGLPAIGFAAINYINANVTPGVLSNYSAAYPHRNHSSCTNSANPQSACP